MNGFESSVVYGSADVAERSSYRTDVVVPDGATAKADATGVVFVDGSGVPLAVAVAGRRMMRRSRQ